MNKTVLYPQKQKNTPHFLNGTTHSNHFNNTYDNCTDNPSPKFAVAKNSEQTNQQTGNIQSIEQKANKANIKEAFHSNQQSVEKKNINGGKNSLSVIGSYAGYTLDNHKSINNKVDIKSVTYKHYRQAGNSVQNVFQNSKSSKENIQGFDKNSENIPTEYKNFIKQEKISQLIGEEFKKKFTKYCSSDQSAGVYFKLCMHFLKALIEYNKPYSLILTNIKKSVEEYIKNIIIENDEKLQSFKKSMDDYKNENDILKKEIEALKKDKKIPEENINTKSSQDSSSSPNLINQTQIVSKPKVLVPKLDLTMITKSRKTEKIVVVYPEKKCKELSKSLMDFSYSNDLHNPSYPPANKISKLDF